jgi:hypothetical protein
MNKMDKSNMFHTCINCGRSETVIPLLALRFSGSSAWICSQCMPVLIHKPHLMADKLANGEKVLPTNNH